MESCTVETGLLRKTPCGHTAVAKCANCEQPLCTKHAIAQVNEQQKKTGKFFCAECSAADRRFQRTSAAATAHPPAKPAAAPAKPAAATPAKPPAAGAPAKPPAAPAKPPEKPEENSDGSIDFTPSKK